MVAAAALSGPATVFMPLRMIGGILLGAEALDPAFPLLNAVLAGGLVHLALSAVFGVVGGALLGAAAPIRRSSNWAIGLATVYGYLLWLVNFFVLAYIAGWTWFPEDTNPIVQFLAHTVGFGTVLGVYLASRLVDPSREND